jgi:hypothetical protein
MVLLGFVRGFGEEALNTEQRRSVQHTRGKGCERKGELI